MRSSRGVAWLTLLPGLSPALGLANPSRFPPRFSRPRWLRRTRRRIDSRVAPLACWPPQPSAGPAAGPASTEGQCRAWDHSPLPPPSSSSCST
eukprot:1759614-Rhodomonas_salina.1